jgi:hypothetical protein
MEVLVGVMVFKRWTGAFYEGPVEETGGSSNKRFCADENKPGGSESIEPGIPVAGDGGSPGCGDVILSLE